MRRLVAAVLACALGSWGTMASALHVHEYVGHDHPDHHHGPATHEHGHLVVADREHHSVEEHDDPAIEAESCDPGRHAVTVSMGCAYVPQVHVDFAALPGPTSEAASSPTRSAIALTDVRVHGPPFDARTPSRAPPVNPHA